MLYITKLSQVVSFNVSSSLFMCHWQDLIHSLADVQSLKGHVHQCLIRQIVIYAFSFFFKICTASAFVFTVCMFIDSTDQWHAMHYSERVRKPKTL